MATIEQNAIAHDTSVKTIPARTINPRSNVSNGPAPMATLCEKRGARLSLEIQLAAANTGTAAARQRIGEVSALSNVIKLISNGRDALELNGASPVRVNVSEADYYSMLKQIADNHRYAAHDIEHLWLAGVRVEKSTRTVSGRLQLIGADGSILNLNWSEDTPDRTTLPSTIHQVDFSSPRL